MSDITRINPDDIRNYSKISEGGGVGEQARKALNDYTSRLADIRTHAFKRDDSSTAHAVLDELYEEVTSLSETMDSVDVMLDTLINIIQEQILDKEDILADEIMRR